MPAVAGRFYPGERIALARQVEDLLPAVDAAPVVALMAPHAGYVYSGATAGRTFAAAVVPSRVIIMCPNHTGRGPAISVMHRGAYRMPGGDVLIDEALADAVLAEVEGATADRSAHTAEHAIEVELPFLVARNAAVKIVPIVLGLRDKQRALSIGRQLWQAVRSIGAERDTLVVASTDMSHFLTDEECRKVDQIALDPVLAFDPAALHDAVTRHDISMCGYVPTTAMLSYAQLAGAAAPELVDYSTSGDAFGDRSRVVGYAGAVLRAEP